MVSAATQEQGEALAAKLASSYEGAIIFDSDWAMLTVKQRERVTLDLETLGLVMIPSGVHFKVSDAESQRGTARMYAVNPDFQFIVHPGDRRIGDADDVYVTILNCRSEHEAAAKLARWLADLSKVGATVFAEDEPVSAEPDPSEIEDDEAESPPFETAEVA